MMEGKIEKRDKRIEMRVEGEGKMLQMLEARLR